MGACPRVMEIKLWAAVVGMSLEADGYGWRRRCYYKRVMKGKLEYLIKGSTMTERI
jgi:hypothetical protein